MSFVFVAWLTLSLETLHQTYELIKTILGRISRSKPDLSKDSALVTTLLELDKFCHRASSSYNCRLSDDLLSELSELLDEFDLPERDEEIQASKPTSDAPSRSVSKAPVRSTSGTPTPPPPKASSSAAKQARQKNAFEMMMNKAGGSYVASPAKAKEQKPKVRQMTLQEFEDDSMLDNLSAGDLDILERRAQHSAKLKKQPTTSSSKPAAPSSKLHINVVPPKMYPTKPASSSKFKSSFFKDIESEHKAQVREMKAASTTAPRLPTASRLGTGLGAYTGPPKPAPKKVPEPETDSSASDSDSDAENKGVGALLRQVKALPQRPAVPERRSIKILGGPSYGDAVRERENARQKAHFTKMRLRPDITPLIRYVLAWDPSVRTPRPPYPPKVAAELGMPRKVPGAFATAQEYEKTMLPLFLQELWAQFIKDDNQVPPITVEANYRAYEDDFIDIDVVVVGAIPVRFGSVNDTDIVTIRTLDGGKPIFAKVQVFRRKFKESAIKLRILGSMDQKTIQHKTKLVLQKHAS